MFDFIKSLPNFAFDIYKLHNKNMAAWKKVEKRTEDGILVTMQEPIIISASRSTDIPAFYADWFFHRLKIGYSAWTNPFNGVKSYVSYDATRFIVFWSKNPRPLLPYLDYLEERGIACYIQYTLNDYEAEGLEKGVRPLSERIDTFHQLVDRLGKGSVVWRFDPLILTDKIGIDELLRKIEYIGDKLHGYTEKLVFSYADIASYRKVRCNLEKNGILYQEWDEDSMHAMASHLSKLNEKWGYELATCGEKINLDKYAIKHNHCIDDELIAKIAYKDSALMKFLNMNTVSHLGKDFGSIVPDGAIEISENLYVIRKKDNKDKGQREFCGCMKSKDIGEYNTCPHLCEYCYANTTKQMAIDNWNRHQQNKYSDTITGK